MQTKETYPSRSRLRKGKVQGSYTKRVEGSDLPSDYKESNYSLESSEQRRKTGRAPPGQG